MKNQNLILNINQNKKKDRIRIIEALADDNDSDHLNGHNALRLPQTLKSILKRLKQIDFYQKANLGIGEKLERKHYLIITVEEILSVATQNKYGLCLINKQAYVFNGEYWEKVPVAELENFLGLAALKLGVKWGDAKHFNFRNDLIKQFFSTAILPIPERKRNEVLLNLNNGTFVITPELQYLKAHDADDFLKYKLEFNYDPNATAPLFQSYLDRVLPDKQLHMILAEYLGYIFIPASLLKLEKSMILYGTGANGKSVFFEIVFALYGKENVSNFSLQSLTNESGYSRAKLLDMLLNYATEISQKVESPAFKQLVSLEPIECRLPYGEPFILTDYAKLIFNCNELPIANETTDAFYRRFLIIPFNEVIPESERDPQLARKIITTELPGIFNWVLEGLDRLLQQKKITSSAAVNEMLNAYKQQSDSVKLFLSEEGYQPDNQSEMPLKVIYDRFKNFCKEGLYPTISNAKFSKKLKEMGYVAERKMNGFVIRASQKVFVEPASPASTTFTSAVQQV